MPDTMEIKCNNNILCNKNKELVADLDRLTSIKINNFTHNKRSIHRMHAETINLWDASNTVHKGIAHLLSIIKEGNKSFTLRECSNTINRKIKKIKDQLVIRCGLHTQVS